MFLIHLLVGYATLVLLGQDFGLLTTNVVLADPQDKISYEVHPEKKTWDDANNDCSARGMVLAYIVTYQEHKDLIKYITDHNLLPADTTSGYWLGGKYSNNHWVWEVPALDTRQDTNFMAGWQWGEPNRRERNGGDKQDCMEVKYIQGNEFTKSLGWNDMWCDEERGFICQYMGDKPSAR